VLAFNSQGAALGWYVAAPSGQRQKAQIKGASEGVCSPPPALRVQSSLFPYHKQRGGLGCTRWASFL